MGFRFRKSINLGGGFKINLSKSGVGYSWGTKGARITKTAKGTKRTTLSVPGTGISYVSEKKRKQSRSSKIQEIQSKPDYDNTYMQQYKQNTQEGERSGMKKLGKFSKNTVMWVLTAFFAITFLVYIPHIASFLSLALALVFAPIQKWQNILSKYIKGKTKVLIAIVLFILTLIAVPTSETTNNGIPTETKPVLVSETTEETTAPTAEPSTEPTTESTTEYTTEPTTEPTTEYTTEPTTEPITESTTEPTMEPTTEPTEDDGWDYVLNTNSKKFHYPSCSSADDIKASNRKDYHGTREEIIAKGYDPCGRCHP